MNIYFNGLTQIRLEAEDESDHFLLSQFFNNAEINGLTVELTEDSLNGQTTLSGFDIVLKKGEE